MDREPCADVLRHRAYLPRGPLTSLVRTEGARPRSTSRRNLITVAEWCSETSDKPDTVRAWIHRGLIDAIDLNGGTGKRPRWRIPARSLRRRLNGWTP